MILDIISAQQISADRIKIDLISEYDADFLNGLTFTIQHNISKVYYTDKFKLEVGNDLKTLYLSLIDYNITPLPNASYIIYISSPSTGYWDSVTTTFNQAISSIQLVQINTKKSKLVFDKLLPVSFYDYLEFSMYKMENGTPVDITSDITIITPDYSNQRFSEIEFEFINDVIENRGEYYVICEASYTETDKVTITSNTLQIETYLEIKNISLTDNFDLEITLNTGISVDIIKNLGVYIADSLNNIIHDSSSTNNIYFHQIEESNNFNDEYTNVFFIRLNSYSNLLKYDTYTIRLYNEISDSSKSFDIQEEDYIKISGIDTSTYGIVKVIFTRNYPKEFLDTVLVDIRNEDTNESVMNYFSNPYTEQNADGTYNSISVSLLDEKYNIPSNYYDLYISSSNNIVLDDAYFESKILMEIVSISQIDLFSLEVRFKDDIEYNVISNMILDVEYEENGIITDISSLFDISYPSTEGSFNTVTVYLKNKSDVLPDSTLTIEFLSAFHTPVDSGSITINNSAAFSIIQEDYNSFKLTFLKEYPNSFLLNSSVTLFKITDENSVDYTDYISDIISSNSTLISGESSSFIYIKLDDNLKPLPEGNYEFCFKSGSNQELYSSKLYVDAAVSITRVQQSALSIIDIYFDQYLPLYYLRSLGISIRHGETDISNRFKSISDYISTLYDYEPDLTENSKINHVQCLADESIGIPNGDVTLNLYDTYGNYLDTESITISNDISILLIERENVCEFRIQMSKDVSTSYVSNLTLNVNKIVSDSKVDVTNLFSNILSIYYEEDELTSNTIVAKTNTPSIILEQGVYEFILTHQSSDTTMDATSIVEPYEFGLTSASQNDLFNVELTLNNLFTKGYLSNFTLVVYKGAPSYEKDKNGNIIKTIFPTSVVSTFNDLKTSNNLDVNSYDIIDTLLLTPTVPYNQIPEGELTFVLEYNGVQSHVDASFGNILNSSSINVRVSNIGDEIEIQLDKEFPLDYVKTLHMDIIKADDENSKINIFESISSKNITVEENTDYDIILYPVDKSYFIIPGNYIIRIWDTISNTHYDTEIRINDFISSPTQDNFDILFKLSQSIPVSILKGLKYELFDINESNIETKNTDTYLSLSDSNNFDKLSETAALDEFVIKTIDPFYDLPEGDKKIRIYNDNIGYENVSSITTSDLFYISRVNQLLTGLEIDLSTSISKDYADILVLEIEKVESESNGKITYGEEIVYNYDISYEEDDNGMVKKFVLKYLSKYFNNPIGKYEVRLTNLVSKKVRTAYITFDNIIESVEQYQLFNLKIDFVNPIPYNFLRTLNVNVYDVTTEGNTETLTDITKLFKTLEMSNNYTSDNTEITSAILQIKDITKDMSYGTKRITFSSSFNSFKQQFDIYVSNILNIKSVTVGDYQEICVNFNNSLPVEYLMALDFSLIRLSDSKDFTFACETITKYNELEDKEKTEYFDSVRIQTTVKDYELPNDSYILAIRNKKKDTPQDTSQTVYLPRIYTITNVSVDESYNLTIDFTPAMQMSNVVSAITPVLIDSNYDSNKIDYTTFYKSFFYSNETDDNSAYVTSIKLQIAERKEGDPFMFADNTYRFAIKQLSWAMSTEYFDFTIKNELPITGVTVTSSQEITLSLSKDISHAYTKDLVLNIVEKKDNETEIATDISAYFNNISTSNNIDTTADEGANITKMLSEIKFTLNSLMTKDIYDGEYTVKVTNSKSDSVYTSSVNLIHMCTTHGDISAASVVTSRSSISGYTYTSTTSTTDTTDTAVDPNENLPNVPCLKITLSKTHKLDEIKNSSVIISDSKGNELDIFKNIDDTTYMVKNILDETISNEIYLEMNDASLLDKGTYKITWNWNSEFYEDITFNFTQESKVFSNFGKVINVELEHQNIFIYLEKPIDEEYMKQFTLSYVSDDDKEDYSSNIVSGFYDDNANCMIYELKTNSSIDPGSYTVKYTYDGSTIISEFNGILPGLIDDPLFNEYAGDYKTVYIIKRTKGKNIRYLLYTSYDKALKRYKKIHDKNIANKEQYEKCQKCQKKKVIYTKKLDIALKNLRFDKKLRYRQMIRIVGNYLKNIFGCPDAKLSETVTGKERTIECMNQVLTYKEITEKMIIASAKDSYSGSVNDEVSYLVYYKWKGIKKYALFVNAAQANEYIEWLKKKNKANNKKAKNLCSKCIKKELGRNKKGNKINLSNMIMPISIMNDSEVKKYTIARLNSIVTTNIDSCIEADIKIKKNDEKTCKAACSNRVTVDNDFTTKKYECEECE